MRIPDGVIREILDDLTELSGLVLFRVTGTWASLGRTGKIDEIVVARDAIEAAQRAWLTEDNSNLRSIHVEWLCPVESVKKWSDYELERQLAAIESNVNWIHSQLRNEGDDK